MRGGRSVRRGRFMGQIGSLLQLATPSGRAQLSRLTMPSRPSFHRQVTAQRLDPAASERGQLSPGCRSSPGAIARARPTRPWYRCPCKGVAVVPPVSPIAPRQVRSGLGANCVGGDTASHDQVEGTAWMPFPKHCGRMPGAVGDAVANRFLETGTDIRHGRGSLVAQPKDRLPHGSLQAAERERASGSTHHRARK